MKTKSKSQAGGGVNSRQVKQVKLRTGGPNRAINKDYVSQLGQQLGNPKGIAKLGGGKALPSKLGNEVATNVNGGGPGRGRVLHGPSGTNQQYGKSAGNVNEGSRSGELFPGFGGKE